MKVFLIGGTSHVGKSTVARRLAGELGWNCLSTDQLARHPGRPWRDDGSALPNDVVQYYSEHSTQALADSVMEHYRQNVWPIVDAVIRSHLNNPYEPCLMLEGSAILADAYLAAGYERVGAIWLTAPADLIASRIYEGSQFEKRSAASRKLIAAFLERSQLIDRITSEMVAANGQRCLDVGEPNALDSFIAAFLAEPM